MGWVSEGRALRNSGKCTMRKLVSECFCSAETSSSLAYPGAALCRSMMVSHSKVGPRDPVMTGRPFLQQVTEVCPAPPAYQKRWQRRMRAAPRSSFSYRVLLQTFFKFLRWRSFFCKGQFMQLFPYWVYFVSIAHVYYKSGTKKHILLRLSGTTLQTSDTYIILFISRYKVLRTFFNTFKLWENYSNSLLERTVELSKSYLLSLLDTITTISPNQLQYLKATSLLLGFPCLSRSSAPCSLPSPSASLAS